MMGCKVQIVVIGKGSHRFMDFFPFGINKGVGAKFFLKKFNPSENTRIVGFGDSMNDRDLLVDGVREGFFVKNIEPDCFDWYQQNKDLYKHIQLSKYKHAEALLMYMIENF
jgi:hydroxymethylpyrimidine pyrophosphatase-like HAD family hydrolase